MSARTKALIGGFAWLAFSLPQTPNVHHGIWGQVLVQFAALVIAPLLFEVVRHGAAGAAAPGVSGRVARGPSPARDSDAVGRAESGLRWAATLQLPAALLLVAAFRFDAGVGAAWCAMPWAGVLLLLAVGGVLGVLSGERRSPAGWCRAAGLVFAAVGAAWLMADRAGLRPLGFDETIVLLTAVHFHYAGLILPVLAGEALERWRRPRGAVWIASGVVAGVPAVAVGITASQLSGGNAVELAAALVMAVSGAAVGWLHLALGLRLDGSVGVRCLWIVAGCSLIAGMILAALYGLRGVFAPWPWLDIPWMRALHGTANALAFGLCGTLAWWRVVEKQRVDG